jgi:hypothetical protein
MRQRFCKVCRDWHALDEPWPEACIVREPSGRSSLPMPMVISDNMQPGVHPYDMRTHDSKASWRAANRAGGYVEVGNDPQRFRKPQPKIDRAGIRETLKQAKARVGI